jgi:tetratricopeptide (TPR) repeat protein
VSRISRRAGRTGTGPFLALGLGLAGLSGCGAAPPSRLVVVTSSLAQTVSLLGDTLYGLSRSGEGGPARARAMADAREAMQRDSSDLRTRLRYARSTAEMGDLREAIHLYSRIAQSGFEEPRVYRERGELLFRLRQFDAALADLRKAALLLIGRSPILEAGPIGEDPEEGSPPVTTTQFQVFFFQGLTLYCKGDYAAAAPVLLEAVRQAGTTDDRARALLWLFFTARRLGDGSEARRILDLVQPAWAAATDTPELTLLLGFQGTIPTDTIRARALGRMAGDARLLSYGMAFALLLLPDRQAEAELWLERSHSGSWDALAYVVAEADLARLRKRGTGGTGAAGLEPATSRLTAGRSAS